MRMSAFDRNSVIHIAPSLPLSHNGLLKTGLSKTKGEYEMQTPCAQRNNTFQIFFTWDKSRQLFGNCAHCNQTLLLAAMDGPAGETSHDTEARVGSNMRKLFCKSFITDHISAAGQTVNKACCSTYLYWSCVLLLMNCHDHGSWG